jgi:flavin reductase (DIM6/NTAB) family NADH-FMN oxidoreductase RutF
MENDMPGVLKEINPEAVHVNIFQTLSKNWMMIAAGTKERYNAMTASWGGQGFLWNKMVCFCFIRPERYTFELMEEHDYFSICFFDLAYKKALEFCGTYSGREMDKIAQSGLKAKFSEIGTPYIEEAKLVYECRKIYSQDVDPDRFLDAEIHSNYSDHDYHRMYVGEIVHCLTK